MRNSIWSLAPVPDFPLGARSADHVSRDSQAACGPLRHIPQRPTQTHEILGPDISRFGRGLSQSENELAEEIRERFRRSVEGQMISDVPIGAFLSAGLDSSSIVAMMARSHAGSRCALTRSRFLRQVPGRGKRLDDPDVATRLARQLGCENQRIVVEPDVAKLLPRLTWHMDEPTADPAIIPAYLVCREARKQATVLLSGVGGDEFFAGYRKHSAHHWAEAYQRIPAAARNLIAGTVLRVFPAFGKHAVKGSVRLTKKMARSASLSPADRFMMNCTYLDAGQKAALIRRRCRSEIAGDRSGGQHRAGFEQVEDADFLNQMLYLDTKIFMVSLNLTYNDKMSMASSVEVRVPFLDRELAEFVAWNVPPEMKLKGFFRPTTKYIFRQAMEDILPREVLPSPKPVLRLRSITGWPMI